MESGPFLETKLSNSTPVTVNNNVNTLNVPVSSICSDVTVGLLTSYEQNLFTSDIFTNTCSIENCVNNVSCSAFSNDTDNYCSESDSTKAESEFTLSDDESTFPTESENRDNDINLQFKGFKEGLSLYYTNADNLLFKLDELKVRIQLVSPDILIITEIYPKTEKSSDITDEEILIDNYTLY